MIMLPYSNEQRRQFTNYSYQYQRRDGRGGGYGYCPPTQTVLNPEGFRNPNLHPLISHQNQPCNNNYWGQPPMYNGAGPHNRHDGYSLSTQRRKSRHRNRSLRENQMHNIQPRWGRWPNHCDGNSWNNYSQMTNSVRSVEQSQPPPIEISDKDVGIKMISIPFFEILATPMQGVVDGTRGILEHSCLFNLKEPMLSLFRNNRTPAPYQIQIRMCKFDKRLTQKDYFPSDLVLMINERRCYPPGWNIIPKPNGQHEPVDITDFCKFDPNNNSMSVKSREHLFFFVHVTKRLTPDNLMENLKKTVIPSSTTVAKIKEKLQQDNTSGDDITLTSLQFSLVCPISKTRMVYPCRASTCQHLQCFDAAHYIKMNERKPKWICPVCFVVLEFKNLQIDQYFKNIIDQNITTKKILLQADGTYKPFEDKDNTDHSILTLDDSIEPSTAATTKETGDRDGSNTSPPPPPPTLNPLLVQHPANEPQPDHHHHHQDTQTSSITHSHCTDEVTSNGSADTIDTNPYLSDQSCGNEATSTRSCTNNPSSQASTSTSTSSSSTSLSQAKSHSSSQSSRGGRRKRRGRWRKNSDPSKAGQDSSSLVFNEDDVSKTPCIATIDLLTEDDMSETEWSYKSPQQQTTTAAATTTAATTTISNTTSTATTTTSNTTDTTTNCASNNVTKVPIPPDVVTLSSDESDEETRAAEVSVMGYTFRQGRKSRWDVRVQEPLTSSTPKSSKSKRKRERAVVKQGKKGKGTQGEMTTIIPNTSTPIDSPPTRMVLRKRTKVNYVE